MIHNTKKFCQSLSEARNVCKSIIPLLTTYAIALWVLSPAAHNQVHNYYQNNKFIIHFYMYILAYKHNHVHLSRAYRYVGTNWTWRIYRTLADWMPFASMCVRKFVSSDSAINLAFTASAPTDKHQQLVLMIIVSP